MTTQSTEARLREPAWKRIYALFNKHGMSAPPTRLRDELVMHLLACDREQDALAAPAQSPWREIESAPKDLTEILGSDGEDVFVMQFEMHAQPGFWSRDVNDFLGNSNGPDLRRRMEVFPTHWMPLPPPPSGGE
jgi:hypothetical protein